MQTQSESDTTKAIVAALPQPIADYVDANARLDIEAMLKPFADDAVILDNGQQYAGLAAIRTLFEEEVIPVRAIFTPDRVRHENGKIILEGPAHGDFKGSPIRFTYDFMLENGGIAMLDITA